MAESTPSALGKRSSDGASHSQSQTHSRARLEVKPKNAAEADRSVVGKGKDRWRPHRATEDYVNFVGDIMYPKTVFPAPGYDASKGRFPFERISTLGFLLNPMRRPMVIEKWSPHEVAVFEASLTLFGKNFHQVAKFIKTKTTKDVIEFYYVWKKVCCCRRRRRWFCVFRPRPLHVYLCSLAPLPKLTHPLSLSLLDPLPLNYSQPRRATTSSGRNNSYSTFAISIWSNHRVTVLSVSLVLIW